MTTVPRGRKAQRIDLSMLKLPLMAFPDVPELGGTPGHVAIAPVDGTGEVDLKQLEEWASFRKSGSTHALTQLVLDAVAEPNVKGTNDDSET